MIQHFHRRSESRLRSNHAADDIGFGVEVDEGLAEDEGVVVGFFVGSFLDVHIDRRRVEIRIVAEALGLKV